MFLRRRHSICSKKSGRHYDVNGLKHAKHTVTLLLKSTSISIKISETCRQPVYAHKADGHVLAGRHQHLNTDVYKSALMSKSAQEIGSQADTSNRSINVYTQTSAKHPCSCECRRTRKGVRGKEAEGEKRGGRYRKSQKENERHKCPHSGQERPLTCSTAALLIRPSTRSFPKDSKSSVPSLLTPIPTSSASIEDLSPGALGSKNLSSENLFSGCSTGFLSAADSPALPWAGSAI